MSMLRLDLFRRVVSRCLLPASFLAMVLPATVGAEPHRMGRVGDVVVLADGEVRLYNFGSPDWQISATDVDESIQTALLSELETVQFRDNIRAFLDDEFRDTEIRVFLNDGSLITHRDSFAGNWAFAVGLFDDAGDPQLFFQMRSGRAVPKPTVLDDSLAQEFVDAGLWTSVDDYIEFGFVLGGNGFASFVPVPVPTGPDDYFSFGPEPSTFVLAMLALLSAVATFRRNRKR